MPGIAPLAHNHYRIADILRGRGVLATRPRDARAGRPRSGFLYVLCLFQLFRSPNLLPACDGHRDSRLKQATGDSRGRSGLNFASRFQSRVRRTLTLYLGAKIALAVLVLAVSAATITVTPTSYTAELGGAVNVSNKLTGIDKGFAMSAAPATATGASCATSVTFTITPGTIVTTAVTSNDYIYDIQIANTTQTPTSTCYKVLLTLTATTGVQTTYGPLYIATDSPASAWQPLDAQFDIGATLPSSPFSFLIVVTCELGTCP